MPDKRQILHQLVAMSCALGDPAKDYLTPGGGNTSARIDDETFFVKASGMRLESIDESGFVEVRFEGVLALLEEEDLSRKEVQAGLKAAKKDPTGPLRPSVETILHAQALSTGAASFVGHTHPTMVNAILCSQKAEEAFSGRLFPDEIVVCGPAPVYVPYVDFGLPLARAVWGRVERYTDLYGEWPKVVLLQNHGLIALGESPQEVLDITDVMVTAAKVLLGAYALGGPHFMSAEQVGAIHTHPAEVYRRQVLGMGQERS
ncbi:MAG: class II aldolase/adducin family protein [Chloroflexota bacterium]|nr:class II aldolase/adducin family protein [Chloroflexota bacterium]